MTRANLMRNLTDKKNEERKNARVEAHKKYASKLMRKNIRKEALKGRSIIEIITKRKFSIVLISDILKDNGFNVTEAKARNGKNMLVVKW